MLQAARGPLAVNDIATRVGLHPNTARFHLDRLVEQGLAERHAPFRRVDAASATQQLVETLDDFGFAPEAVTTGRGRQVLLHRCPFRDTAEEHRDVVCAVHLGLMRGMLAELDAPVDAKRLDPFAAPNLCVTRLVSRSKVSARSHRRTS